MPQPSYFVDHKRGEVNELRQLLRNAEVQRDPRKRRDVIKKVIAYMTLGIDVSRLFSEMTMASNTKDPVQKKMVYLYLTTYAEKKADLAIMAINTLHKDARDENTMVRGLALRSLCSLRLPNLPEYVLQPIRNGLQDPSAYVRKTAVLGVAKLHSKHAQAVRQTDLVDVLYGMLRDKDTTVVCNVICALNEVLADEGGMVVNAQIMAYLLSRLYEFSEWGQCIVLDLAAGYEVQSEEEMYDVMNLLEDRLQHSNAAVVLGATKVFLQYTAGHPDVHAQVYQRLRAPLLTNVSSGSHELAYSVLAHIELLVERAPGVFDDDFKSFFIRYNDPACVKMQKLGILEKLANAANASELLAEYGEYVTDVSADIARRALQGIGSVAIRIPGAADEAIEMLLSFLDLSADYVTAEAAVVMKDLLRKYPERYEEVIPAMQRCLASIEEPAGKVAVVWMVGEYGDTIRDAPYILEPLVDTFDDEAQEVRLELLTATMKLFFKRPPELQAMLGRLLSRGVEDTTHVDVRDRALLYYRLLRYDVHEAARVVNCPKVIVDHFVELEDKEHKDRIFREFNSLSVVYNREERLFVTGVELDEDEEDDFNDDEGGEGGDGAGAGHHRDDSAASGPPAAAAAAAEPAEPYASPAVADILGGGFGAPDAGPSWSLQASPAVDPQTFQAQWGRLPVAETVRLQLGAATKSVAPRLDTVLAPRHVATMASGTVDNATKYYFFARKAGTGALYFVECVVQLGSGDLVATVKGEDAASVPDFCAMLRDAISTAV